MKTALPRVSPRWSLLTLLAGIAVCGTLLYFPTFSASFAFDDMDYLNHAADALAGKVSYASILFRPQGEHFVPVLNVLFHANAFLFGANAFPLRLLVFLAHLVSALLLGVVVRRYAADPWAPLAAGLAYVAPAGFSSMWVWLLAGGGVPLGLLGITGALALIAWQDRIGKVMARLFAGLCLLFALACENSLFPLAATPALLDEFERRRGGRRGVGLFALFCLAAAAAAVILSSVFYTKLTGNRIALHPRAGLWRAVFLLSAAPFRYFFPGLSLPRPAGGEEGFPLMTALFGIAVALLAALLLLSLLRERARPLAAVALLAVPGSAGVIGLVGLGRSQVSFGELYDADRYFFTLLIPIALFAAALACGLRELSDSWPISKRYAAGTILLAFFFVEISLHRLALLGRVPFQIYAAHENRFDQLALLGRRLSEAARALPAGEPAIEFPDSGLYFEDIHNNRVSARFLIHVANRDKSARLRLGGESVGKRDEDLINPVLDAWAREIGESIPYLSIEDGRLVNARDAGRVDFRIQANESRVLAGFYGWEGAYRWMRKRGLLSFQWTAPRFKLVLALPWDEIRRKYPDWDSVRISVSAAREPAGEPIRVGEIRLSEGGIQTHVLVVPEPVVRMRGHPLRIILESDRTFRASDIIAGSKDERELAVQLFVATFEKP